MASRYNRLTPTDLMFLRLETDEWPCHFGGLAVLEGGLLLDGSGRLRLEELRRRLDLRITHIPDLRQRVHHPGWLGGKPMWVDDSRFAIEHHVHAADVPGGDAGFLRTATQIYEKPLDRDRPLWELWFLTGLGEDRVGLLFKLHHAVADGLAAVAVLGALFDLDPDSPDPEPVVRYSVPVPTYRDSVTDNLATRWHAMLAAGRRAARPRAVVGALRSFLRMTRGFFGSAAVAAGSLNAVVGRGRLVRSFRIDLSDMKQIAHAHGGKVNDVVLTLWTGGLRGLLDSRGEPVSGVEAVTGMATTLRPSTGAGETIDNRVGTMMLRLPLCPRDAGERLSAIVPRTVRTKAEWRPAATMGYLAALAGTPVGHYFVTRQKASNTLVTNVMGPPVPVYLFGAKVLEILPIIELVGNIGLTLCAFSYAGRMSLVVTADEATFPDIEVLMEGMRRDWQELADAAYGEPTARL